MNLAIHTGNVTGDLDAICNASFKLDNAYFYAAWDALMPLDAPEKINTGAMVHVDGFTTEGGSTIATQQFQRSYYRDFP